MANIRGTRVLGDRRQSRDHLVEEFVPLFGWTEDSKGYYLLVQLPVDSNGDIILSGERKVNGGKAVYVKQTYELPKDSDVDKITGTFDEEHLHITIPRQEEKVVESEHEENAHISPGPMQRAMELLMKNRGIALAIVVAFSLGVLVSRMFESTGQ
ncbi:hypothetical protein SLE2022_376500 [Rubroshorea leprosula]